MRTRLLFYFVLLLMAAHSLLMIEEAYAQRPAGKRGEQTKIGSATVASILSRLGAELEHGVTRNQLGDYYRQFDLADLDGDGRHSKTEYIEKGNYLTPQARRGIFNAADNDSDGFVTKSEYTLNRIITDEAKAIVQAMDDDKDWSVERAEFIKHATTKLSDAELSRQVFDALDTDGNGDIPVPEYLRVWGKWARAGRNPPRQRIAAREEQLRAPDKKATGDTRPGRGRPGGPPSVAEVFQRFDANNDGKLQKKEIPEFVRQFILPADTNKDGFVTKQELEKYRANRGGGRPQGRRGPPVGAGRPGPQAKSKDDWQPTEEMIKLARGNNPRFNVGARVLSPDYTGLSRAELGRARRDGTPLADLIKKNGKSVEEYLERTLKIADGVLRLNVAEGLMSQSRADAVRGFMRGNITAMVYGRVDRSERNLAQPLLDFEWPVAGLRPETEKLFTLGKAIFKRNWVESPSKLTDRDGLGPLFNANSCNACHFRDGRGRPETGGKPGAGLLVRLSIRGSKDKPQAEPNYGIQFHDLAVPGQQAEGKLTVRYETVRGKFADGETYELRKPTYDFHQLSSGPMHSDVMLSARVAPHLIGMGLLEAVPESAIRSLADPNDDNRDGISGRVNFVFDLVKKEKVLGRFGWKAGAPNVLQQTAAAFVGHMGITSSLFPSEPFSASQQRLRAAAHGGRPEISDEHLCAVAAYSSLLSVPIPRDRQNRVVKQGEQLFHSMQCAACHVPSLPTQDHPEFRELKKSEIEPYTDLLLHDMGKGLADGRPDGLAHGNEWRTPPLWGIGLFQKVNGHTFFLHDGRARNLTEAILWHGGEAEAAREAFRKARGQDRIALLRFLESL